ncbi:hypothetical protein ACFP2F_08190 [Hymenobacter artigasi]|uniref:FTP domain-containing protein n=1 Tax=Hymenobacter artigasi TaxID=2719616 RepID=A0ABX1HGB4_9BACT|nr:hypothetical protein [Hymenobacter artigasi]NKI89232.1 hypothetical protein [Hymenobacter artigasi]
MKYLLIAACALAPVLLACSKSEADPAIAADSGCSELVVMPATAHAISPAQVQRANVLFAQNSLDLNRVRYVRFWHDSVQTYYPPYAPLVTDHVSVDEYANGLRIFTNQINYAFKGGVLYYTAGTLTRGTQLNAQPALRVPQLRTLFFAAVAAFDPSNLGLATNCAEAEFGYYNLNTAGNTTENLVKAWKVAVKGMAYPFAFFEDNGGRLIYYDNGIRTFR